MNSIPSAGEAIQKGASGAGAVAGSVASGLQTAKDMAAHPTEIVSKGVDAMTNAGVKATEALDTAGGRIAQSGKGLVHSGKEAVTSGIHSVQKMGSDMKESFMSGYNEAKMSPSSTACCKWGNIL